MADISFMQFLKMLLSANEMAMNNQNFIINNNNNMNIEMMIRMMGINGANPINLLNMFNQQQVNTFNQNQYHGYINLIFMHKLKHIRIIVQAEYGESIASVVNKYITKSCDSNVNIYIVNGRRLDETKTVMQSGLKDNYLVDVVSVQDVEGA